MTERVHLDLHPVRWDRARWAEGDVEGTPIDFLMEFNADGVVLRQIELAGPAPEPIAAASAAEWWEAQGWVRQAPTPAVVEYERLYGVVAEGSVGEWGPDYPGESISSQEFERVWVEAREHLERSHRPRA